MTSARTPAHLLPGAAWVASFEPRLPTCGLLIIPRTCLSLSRSPGGLFQALQVPCPSGSLSILSPDSGAQLRPEHRGQGSRWPSPPRQL